MTGQKTSFALLCILQRGVTFTGGVGHVGGLSSGVNQSSATGHSRVKKNVKERKKERFEWTLYLLHVQSHTGQVSTHWGRSKWCAVNINPSDPVHKSRGERPFSGNSGNVWNKWPVNSVAFKKRWPRGPEIPLNPSPDLSNKQQSISELSVRKHCDGGKEV